MLRGVVEAVGVWLLLQQPITVGAIAAAAAGDLAGDPGRCDVLVAGGSTAALSAALTAAVAEPALSICLTEPTDELGGQLNYNPAIDYGHEPEVPGREWAALVGNVTDARSAT